MKNVFKVVLILEFFINISYGQVKTINGKILSIEELNQFIRAEMDSFKLPGLSVAVINDGHIVYHGAFGLANIAKNIPVNDSTLFEAASLSKTAFAFFTLKLAEKGMVDLDKPLYKYLPNPDIDYDDRYKLITARMVLCHSSGFPNWRSDNKGVQLNIQFTPGTKYSYSGEGYEYLTNVIAHITHTNLKDLGKLFDLEVGKPLGLDHFYFTWNDYLAVHKATGYYGKNAAGIWQPDIFRSASSLQTESMDYAKFLIAIMDERGLSKSEFDEMLKEQIAIPNGSSNGHDAFGLGIYMEPTTYGMKYAHNGNNGDFTSGYVFFKSQKFGYVFFTNCDSGGAFNKRIYSFLTEGL